MAMKRRAETELTPENWDGAEEDAKPDSGFARASEEELATRKFMPAKRRLGNQDGESADSSMTVTEPPTSTGSLFKGFKGFSSTGGSSLGLLGQSTAFSASSGIKLGDSGAQKTEGFSFLGKTDDAPKSTAFPTFKLSSDQGATKSGSDENKPSLPSFLTGGPSAVSLKVTTSMSSGKSFSGATSSSKGDLSVEEYEEQLRSLNRSVVEWITQHVKDNALCDLTPVFDDYKKHLADLDHRAEASPSSSVDTTTETSRVVSAVDSTTTAEKSSSKVSFSSMPSFPLISSTSSSSSTTAPGGGFFSSAIAASSNSNPTASKEQANGEQCDEDAEEQEDEGPPPEFDKDADVVHTIRAKLFYKKDDNWKDLALGMFKIINLDGKTQLLMRNDTRLGNILLNVMLSSSTPCTRNGKNNVMLVAVPNPPLGSDPTTPVTYLVRVKTAGDADDLHKRIEDRKKMA